MNLKRVLPTTVAAFALALALTTFVPPAFAGLGGENVAVVVNADSWASMTVANEFIKLRQVPPGNVIYLSNLPNEIHMKAVDFRAQVLQPVFKTLTERGLIGQIDCIAYSTDFPCAVDGIAINTVTFSYERTLAAGGSFGFGVSNFYFRRVMKPQEKKFDAAGQAEFTKTFNLLSERLAAQTKLKKFEADKDAENAAKFKLLVDQKSAEYFEATKKLAEVYPDVLQAQQNLAYAALQAGKLDEAVAALKRWSPCGFRDSARVELEEAFKPLRGRADFQQIVADLKNTPLDTEPPRAFRNSTVWPPEGRFAGTDKGARYMLSCLLGVTSGRGTSVAEALSYLRRSAQSDGAAYSGTFYFMRNDDIRSRVRLWGFSPAILKLRKMGLTAEIQDGTLPVGKPRVAGVMAGTRTYDWPGSRSTMLPGAICDHLTSFGGMMEENAGQMALTEFLRNGAAGACGTIAEPSATRSRFPTPYLQVFYASGFSLIESFYMSVEYPDLLLIVGDPLCQPWAKPPKVAVDGLTPGQVVKGTVEFKPAAADDKISVGAFEIFVNGRRTSLCKPGESVRLDTTSLPDGWTEVRVIAVSADPTEARGRVVIPVTVNNHNLVPEFTSEKKEIQWGQSVELRAKCPGAKKILILHNARELAVIEGEQGTAKINATQLGLGAVKLHACAVLPAAANAQPQFAFAAPLDLTIIAPPALPALKDVPKTLTDGLRLRVPGGKDALVKTTLPKDWLSKAGGLPGKPFQLDGYVAVKPSDVCQFHLRSKGRVRIAVDGREIWNGPAEKWQYLPVSLAEGMHEVVVSCDAAADDFDCRFGGPGTPHLGASRFKCAATGN